MFVATCLVSAIFRSFFYSWFWRYWILVWSFTAWSSICFLFWTSCVRDISFRALLERAIVIWLAMPAFSRLAWSEMLPSWVVEKLFLPMAFSRFSSEAGALLSTSEPVSKLGMLNVAPAVSLALSIEWLLSINFECKTLFWILWVSFGSVLFLSLIYLFSNKITF